MRGPGYTGPLVYGHLAVAVFIVISGFSLTLRPSTNGYALAEGGRGFFRRRFWRIVPPVLGRVDLFGRADRGGSYRHRPPVANSPFVTS